MISQGVVGHMHHCDMKQENRTGTGRVKTPAAFMTHVDGIALRFQRKYNDMHRRIHLIDGRAKAAEVYHDKHRQKNEGMDKPNESGWQVAL